MKQRKSPKNPNSYRPISLLNSLSKILEKLILLQINRFLDDNDRLHPDQFGFRKGHSTTQQLCKTTDAIFTSINRKELTAIISLDIEIAFDAIHLDALIYKLKEPGLPPRLIQIIHSYTTNRKFQVLANN